MRWARTRRHSHPPDGTATRQENPDAEPGAEDDTLVAAARANPEVFELLYERYVRQVYRYCYLKLGSRETAEDATSQVFLDALAGLGGYRGGAFAGWLFRIAQHTVADALRRDRRGPAWLPLTAAGDVGDPAQRPEDVTIAVRAALETLPDDQRVTLELQLAGWSSEQIGAALGRSPSAIRMTRARALKRLRVELADETHTQGGKAW